MGLGDALRPSPVRDPDADGLRAGSQRKAECVAGRSMRSRIAKWRGFPHEGPCDRNTGLVGGETSTSPQRPGRVTAMSLNDRTRELLLRPMAAMLIDQTGLGTTTVPGVSDLSRSILHGGGTGRPSFQAFRRSRGHQIEARGAHRHMRQAEPRLHFVSVGWPGRQAKDLFRSRPSGRNEAGSPRDRIPAKVLKACCPVPP